MTAPNEMWDADIETLPREDLRRLQSEGLLTQIEYVYDRGALLRSLMDQAGVKPRDISGVDDIATLPTLNKDDIRRWREDNNDIFGGTACLPVESLAMVNHSTGTSGAPTVYGLTASELEQVGDIFARALHCMGLRKGDRTPLAATGLWHGAVIGLELGTRTLGAVTYRIACSSHQCVETVFGDWRGSDLTALRTYLPEYELSFFRDHHTSPREIFPSARFVYGGFDASRPKRQLIEQVFDLPFRNFMGSGEQFFAGGECAYSAPYTHMPEDYFVFEVLDPHTGEQVPPGGVGELVISNLWATSFPYLRYRMQDIVTYENDPCPCGRTAMRLKILGRLAWSVQVGDRRVFAGEVEDAIWARPELVGTKYQLVRRSRQPQDVLEIRVGIDPPPGDDVRESAEADLTGLFGVPAAVTFVGVDQIGLQGPMKMARIIDVD